jgi:hypothetical protein
LSSCAPAPEDRRGLALSGTPTLSARCAAV